MNERQEKDIIHTLCRAGHEALAKTFARSRGYRVKGAAELMVTVQNLNLQNADATLQQLAGWFMRASSPYRGMRVTKVSPFKRDSLRFYFDSPDDTESSMYQAEEMVEELLQSAAKTFGDDLIRDTRPGKDVQVDVL